MALSEEALDTVVGQMRAAAHRRRDKVRDQIVVQYKELVALPKKERIAETKRRIVAAVTYIRNRVPARDPDNAAISRQRLRDALRPRFGELTDDELDTITQAARRAVDQDRHEEVMRIAHEVGGRAARSKHGSRVRIDV
jgi:hypothetical protein